MFKTIYISTLFIMGTAIQASAQKKDNCDDNCEKSNNPKVVFTCKLTTPELRELKATVIDSLKSQIQSKEELKNGYEYKFAGSDKTVDELVSFIKTERECCDFFTFNLSVSGDKSFALLEIVGPKGVKKFIKTELDLQIC
jgi:hypothetical protein